MKEINILGCGDIFLGEQVFTYKKGFATNINKKVIEEVKPYFQNCNIGFGNLESPVGKIESNKLSENIFKIPTDYLDLLSNIGFNYLSIANNHILEHGETQYKFTINELEKRNINIIGDKNKSNIFIVNDKKILFLGLSLIPVKAENNFYENKIENIFEIIRQNKEQVDFIFLSIHWGEEFIFEPSQKQIVLARKLIDTGVNIIFGHHSHTYQKVEKYNNGLICYSLGNFIFDMEWQKKSMESFFIKIKLKDTEIKYETIPFKISIKNGISILSGKEKEIFDKRFEKLCTKKEISNNYDYLKKASECKKKYKKNILRYLIKNLFSFSYEQISHIFLNSIKIRIFPVDKNKKI